jgi:hypothetical protein
MAASLRVCAHMTHQFAAFCKVTFAPESNPAMPSGASLCQGVTAPNCEELLSPSKYMRSPAALLWLPPGPMHFVSSGLVPILVRSLRLKVSVVPLNSTDWKGPRSTVTSFASAGLPVVPVRHRAAPEATRIPFLDNSARRSNLVPMSSLFFRPTHAWRLLEEGRSPAVRAGWAAHVPKTR